MTRKEVINPVGAYLAALEISNGPASHQRELAIHPDDFLQVGDRAMSCLSHSLCWRL